MAKRREEWEKIGRLERHRACVLGIEGWGK